MTNEYRGGWEFLHTAAGTRVMAVVQNDEPVCRVLFADPTGDTRQIDLSPAVALHLIVQLAQFCEQVHEGP